MVRKTEAGEQVALFQWAELTERRYPPLRLMYHIPNGGRRDVVSGAHLKAQGVKAGVPDICLPVARGEYHGLYIELKAAEGKTTSDAQRKWITALRRQCYRVVVCYGFEEAKDEIEHYLKM